jgi:LytS/YehU family sensor histidine kinase
MGIYIQPPFWQTWWFRILVVLIVIGALITFIKLRERRIIREQQLQSDFREHAMALEMKALRSQMNPHFIYNSLNSIRLFVMQNQNEDAEKYLVQFSRLMRLILDNSRQEWVSLQSELDLLRLYMELEQLRFDHKFDFYIDVDEALQPEQLFLPPMLLQPYIENAILHGIRHKTGKGNIFIRISKQDKLLRCEIEDDGVGRAKAAQFKKQSVTTHKSIGTQVTEERIHLLKNAEGVAASIQFTDKINEQGQATGTKVILSLPLLTSRPLQA